MLKEISLRNRKHALRVPNSNRNIETRSLTNRRTYSLKAVFFLNKPIFETSILPAVAQTFNIIFGQKGRLFFCHSYIHSLFVRTSLASESKNTGSDALRTRPEL